MAKTSWSMTRRTALALGVSGVALGLGGYHLARRDTDAPHALRDPGGFGAVFVGARQDRSHVSAALFYPYGERHNPMAEGLAHYLEHLVWVNVKDAGTDGGNHSNALTTPASTAYLLSRPPQDLPDMIRRLVASAAPLRVSQSAARQERDIVAREYDLRMLGSPMTPVWQDTTQALFGDSPFARNTLGTPQAIETYDLASAQQLHDQTHHLDQATLVLSGPLSASDVSSAMAAVPDWPAPRAPALPCTVRLWSAAAQGPDTAALSVAGIPDPQLILRQTFAAPDGFEWAERAAARDVLWDMMFSTRPGSLARPLRYDAFVARNFDAGLPSEGPDAYSFWLTATPEADTPLTVLHDTINRHLTALLDAPDPALFDEMKSRLLAGYDSDLTPHRTNQDALFDALRAGLPFVTVAQAQRALKRLSYDRFATFTRHLLNPRTAVVRMVSPSP